MKNRQSNELMIREHGRTGPASPAVAAGGLRVRDLQEQVGMRARDRYSDDPVKLVSIDLWLEQMQPIGERAGDILFELELSHRRVGFGGDDPDVARLKQEFARVFGELMHRSILTANAAGLDLEQVMQEMLQREDL